MYDKNARTKLYNTLMGNPTTGSINNSAGRAAGLSAANGSNDNFFTKKWKSIDNAIGTTGAVIAGGLKEGWETSATENLLRDNTARMNEVAKKYGYNTYHDIWDARDRAEANGDTATLNFIDNTINPELQAQANINAQKADEKAANYKDYMENNDVSKRINQDPGKFAGSAINTLSTATDIMGLTNGPISNAIQGGIEGVADELEQNGLENFSWERAGQNALIGAAAGAAVGAINNTGLVKNLGNGKISQAVLNSKLGQKTLDNALGKGLRTVGAGTARGAISGAVGGATGTGVSSAINGVDLGQGIANTFQGAAEGAKHGATTGAIMTGANSVLNKVPVINDANKAAEDFRNLYEGGEGNRLQRAANAYRETARSDKNWGGKIIRNLAGDKYNDWIAESAQIDVFGPRYIQFSGEPEAAKNYLMKRQQGEVPSAAFNQSLQDTNGDGFIDYTYGKPGEGAKYSGGRGLSHIQAKHGDDALNRVPYNTENGTPRRILNDRVILGNDANNDTTVIRTDWNDNNTGRTIKKQWLATNYDPNDPVSKGVTNRNPSIAETSAGSDEIGTPTNLIIPQSKQNVNPETEVYRMFTGNNSEEKPFMAYGESDLATGKTQKQNIFSKAGRAMEAAQVNATRKETRDIGIDNSGELVNRLRKRTGYSSIDDQAAFGRELTGGENSLLDSIQRNALGVTEDGSTRTVEIDKIIPQVNRLIDEAPNTLISPNQKETVRDAIMADLNNTGLDTIHKANNFKSAAKQQFLINERTPNDSAKELGKLYSKVAELVDDASYAEIPQSQVEAMFETGAREARTRAQVAKNNGNKKAETAYNNLAGELESSPKTVQAYRSIKKDYVDINKLSKKTQQGATAWNNPLTMGSAITAAMMTGNPLTAVPAAWAAKTFAPAIGEAAINTAAKFGGKIADFGDSLSARKAGASIPSTVENVSDGKVIDAVYNPSTQIYNAIGREIGQGEGEEARAAAYLSNAVQEAETAPTSLEGLIVPSTGTATSVYNNVYGQPTTTTATANTPTTGGYFQATGDYWTDLIGRAMSRAIDEDDVTAFATLYGMYQDALSKNSSDKDYSNPVNWSSTDRKSLLQAQNGLDQIDSLEQSYINAVGDGSNVMQGTLRQWANNISGGNLDPSAENYVKQANSIGAGIIKNLVNLGSTEYDAERYIDYLPKLTDTKEQAAQKLQVLRDAYNNVIGNLKTIYNV